MSSPPPDGQTHGHGHDHGAGSHSHGLVDPALVRSRSGLRAVSVSLAVLAATALVQAAIFASWDSWRTVSGRA